MSAGNPGRGAGRGRGPAGTRPVRIVTAILLLLLLVVIAIGVLSRFRPEPGSGQAIVTKAPPPPANRSAAESRANADDRGTAEHDGSLRPPARGAAGHPLVLGDGEARVFIDGTGTVSLPVVVRETGTRIIVESAGEGRFAEVLIAALPGGTATVSAVSGAVDVAAEGRRVRIGAGTFTTVASGAPPSAPERLPPPPDLAAPSGDATFLYGTLPPRISFTWRAREPADGFRFVVARDPGFRRIVLDERLAGLRVTQNLLEEGTYYWRVCAVRKGATGPPGDAARLSIVRRGTPPDLEVRSVTGIDGGYARLVTGRTEPGVKVFVAGTRVPVTAAGSFSCRLILDGSAGAVVVEAVDPLGNAAYRSQWAQ